MREDGKGINITGKKRDGGTCSHVHGGKDADRERGKSRNIHV